MQVSIQCDIGIGPIRSFMKEKQGHNDSVNNEAASSDHDYNPDTTKTHLRPAEHHSMPAPNGSPSQQHRTRYQISRGIPGKGLGTWRQG
jgi:hypothetical protein